MTISLDAIALPDDLRWPDEFDWYPVAQTTDRSLTGALLVQEAALSYGRPITLFGDESDAWITRQTLLDLKALADQADLVMTLNYHGTNYSVIWDRSGNPLSAKPLADMANPGVGDAYANLTLRLLTVEPPAP